MKTLLFFIAVISFLANRNRQHRTEAAVQFTNVKCITADPSYITTEHCFIKSVNRTYKYFSMRLKLHTTELLTNTTVNFSLLKKANGYKPFLYNITFDGCKYLRSRTNPIIIYLHSLFELYSNINHTCPYGPNDFVVEKLPISHIQRYVSDILPLPQGQYMFHSTWASFNMKRMFVKFYWDSI